MARQTARLCPLLKALLAAVSGVKGLCTWKSLQDRDFCSLLTENRLCVSTVVAGGCGVTLQQQAGALALPPDRLAASKASAVVIELASSCCTTPSHWENWSKKPKQELTKTFSPHPSAELSLKWVDNGRSSPPWLWQMSLMLFSKLTFSRLYCASSLWIRFDCYFR